MAETTEELQQEIAAVLESFKVTMQDVTRRLSQATGNLLEDTGKSAADTAKKALGEVERNITGLGDMLKSTMSGENIIADKWVTQARLQMASIKAIFSQSNLELSFDTTGMIDSVKSVMGEAQEFITNPANAVNIAAFLGAEGMAAGVQEFMGPIGRLEERVMELSRAGVEMFRAFSGGADDFGAGALAIDKNLSDFRQTAIAAGLDTGMGFDAAKASLLELGKAGVDVQQILQMDDISVQLGSALPPMDALTAAMRIQAATGMQTAEMGKFMRQGMRELGVQGQDTIDMFGTLKVAQQDTNMRFNEVATTVMAGADKLKFFGNNVESATAIYQSFVQSLGEGREALAGTLFDSVVSGLANMNNGFRAFLGMTGQVGGGAGGALGGMLRVEQALETGNLEGIMGDLQTQIERLSGAPIMSRQQAVDTGQEQQFVIQRQILQQGLGIGDREQAAKVMEMMAGGQQVGVSDIRAQAAAATPELIDEGQDAIDRQITSTQRLTNLINTTGVQALSNMSGSVRNLGTVTRATLPDVAKQFQDFIARLGVSSAQENVNKIMPEGEVKAEDVKRSGQGVRGLAATAQEEGFAGGVRNLAAGVEGLQGGVRNLVATVGDIEGIVGGVRNLGSAAESVATGGIRNLGISSDATTEGIRALGEAMGVVPRAEREGPNQVSAQEFEEIIGRMQGERPSPTAALMRAPDMNIIEPARRADPNAVAAAVTEAANNSMDTANKQVNFTFDEQEMTLSLGLQLDANTLNLTPVIDRLREEMKVMIRNVSINETDGARSYDI